jgi:hypothetical protein
MRNKPFQPCLKFGRFLLRVMLRHTASLAGPDCSFLRKRFVVVDDVNIGRQWLPRRWMAAR